MVIGPSLKKLRIGVMLEGVQLSDVVGIDVFGNLSREYLDQAKNLNPAWSTFEEHAIDVEFFYLATTLEPVRVTPGMRIMPTATYDDCPRDLDIILVGGPSLSHRPPQADKFIKEAWTRTRVWLTTCVGSMWLASSGVLEGKKCTTNREVMDIAKKMHPGIEWLDQRWVIDEKPYDGVGEGELWTAGGAGAGKRAMS